VTLDTRALLYWPIRHRGAYAGLSSGHTLGVRQHEVWMGDGQRDGNIDCFVCYVSDVNKFCIILLYHSWVSFEPLHPPYLYTVATLPWEIQKSHFSTVLFIQTSDYSVISEETNCNCCSAAFVYLLLFTASYYLLSHILWSVFLSVWSVIFKATNAEPQLALFRVTNIWRNATLHAVRCKSVTFYKVVWWHFSGVVGRG